ncbi:hypothetical protein [Halobacteriovorax sp. HLS]|uniref:hypothetical protein n=1 Tax=Halobacteriovorax sp. HLS TaxID=2234000 RepID=UPI000FDBFD12|nr:hypothetical protein [Halobacteriovorax sp. HLS]
MPKSILKLIILFLISGNSLALIEIGSDFSYDRDIFGTNRQSKSTTRTWGGTIAAHLWSTTAIELNYYDTEDTTIVNETVSYTDLSISVLGQQTHIESKNYGIGLRQAFAPRKAFLVPSLSLGYAKIFKKTKTDYKIRNDSTGVTTTSVQPTLKTRDDSMFGTFSIKLRLSKRISLRGSVQTYIRAFDWDGAKDDLRYTVGFTCLL